MKKRIAAVLVMAVVMMAGCGNSNSAEESTGADGQMTENTDQADTYENGVANDTEDELFWAKGTQIDGSLYQNLNLDGVGDSDDEAYVSTYQFGDYEEKVTVISIHLGTGETVAQVFPVYGDYSLQTGKVFSEEKDAIVLQISDLTSNYGAATVFVLNVSPAGVDPIPSVGALLNTTGSIMLADGNIIENSVLENDVTSGTKVVDIEGMPRQGVLIYSIGEEGEYQGLPRIFYWTDDGWMIVSEEPQDISAAGFWDREGAVLLTAEDVMLSCTGIIEDSFDEEMSYEIRICRIDLTNYHLYFRLYDQTAMVQEIECPIEFDLMTRTIETPVIMTDINGDGIKDFILDYGISGQMTLGQCIVWNADKDRYEVLEGYSKLWNPHYDMRQRIIWEMRHEEAAIYTINQYEVTENKLELKASLTEDYGSGHPMYTETRMIDGEMVTIHENVSEGEISLEEWYYH